MIRQFHSPEEAVEYISRKLSRANEDWNIEVAMHPHGAADWTPNSCASVSVKQLKEALVEHCQSFPGAVVAFDTSEWDRPIGVIEMYGDEPIDSESDVGNWAPMVSAFVLPAESAPTQDEKRATLRYLHRQMREWRRDHDRPYSGPTSLSISP